MDCNEVYTNNIIIEKSVNKENAIVGDVLKYCVTVINECEVLINNVTIIDMLDESLKFVNGSVIVDEVPFISSNVLEGVDIGTLSPGEIKTLTFKAKIVERPTTGIIENESIAKFYYDANLNSHLYVTDKTSNTVVTYVDVAEIKIDKKSDKELATRGDIVTYEILLTNIGTVEARNILFMDAIPNEVSLIRNSVEINSKKVNYTDNLLSIYVGSIKPGESILVTYKVIVNSSNCSGLLINKASVKFNYNLCNWNFGEKISTCKEDEINEIKLGISTFKQISIDDNLCIPEVKPDMEEINDVKVRAEVINCHVISTPKIISNEGQALSGYKLVLRGVLKHLVEYTADTPEQSVHSAHYDIPFSTFIILPENYTPGSKLDVDTTIEDVYFKMINCRCFFKNVTLLVNVKVMSC